MKYLILGGTSGIGLEVAKQLSKNNTVCVLGRNFESVNKLNSKNIITLKHEVKSFKELDDFYKNEIYKKYQFDSPRFYQQVLNKFLFRLFDFHH